MLWKETTLNETPDRMKRRFVFYRIEFVLPRSSSDVLQPNLANKTE